MGNSQSKSYAKGGVYKIIDKASLSDFIRKQTSENRKWIEGRCTRDELEEMKKKQIVFVLNNGETYKIATCLNGHLFIDYQIGDYVNINVPMKDENGSITIENSDDMERVGKLDSEGNARDSNGGIIDFLKATNEYANEIVQARERRLAAAEYGRWLNQTEAWTSYNLPPK